MIDDLAALRLQLDWGADEALGTAPIDRFQSAAAPAALPRPPTLAASAAPAHPADAVDGLESWFAALDRFTGCPLRATATHTVRPAGTADAPIVFIADAPGNDDDRSGHAFCGASGALLDQVMGSAGLGRDRMLLTTLVPWRPPGNRPPSASEIAACLPFIHRLLALVRPRAVVLAGSAPVTALTGQAGTIRQLRGRWLELTIPGEQWKLQALPMLPLAQWLRDATAKQQLWSDVQLLHQAVTPA